MSLSKVVPVYLDNRSGWSPAQVEQINIIARTSRNYFLSKAKQELLEKPDIERMVVSKWNRVLNLRDYAYMGIFSISFILNTDGLAKDVTSPLVSLGKKVKSYETVEDGVSNVKTAYVFQFEGSYSDEIVPKSLASLGSLTIETVDNEPTFCFTPNTDDFPEDDNHNRLQFSVFIGGYYDD